jgi:hypothetical protein
MVFENSIESVAESFIELGERISKNWSPYLSEGKTFYEIHGWQNVPLSAVDAEQQAYDIAHRLRDMAERGFQPAILGKVSNLRKIMHLKLLSQKPTKAIGRKRSI